MSDSIDEIKAVLPIETTAAYAGIMALANNDGIASNISLMIVFFVVLCICTAVLSLIRTKSLLALAFAVLGFFVWVINVDYARFSNIIADNYNKYILEQGGDPTFITEGLDIIIPSVAIIYSLILTIVSIVKARELRHAGVQN